MTGAPAAPSLRRWVRAAFAVVVILAVLATVLGGLAFRTLLDARRDVIDRADPAVLTAERLQSALIERDLSVRDLVLSGDESFLAPYRDGVDREAELLAELDRLTGELPTIAEPLERVRATVDAWTSTYAEPTIDGMADGSIAAGDRAAVEAGRDAFDAIAVAITDLEGTLAVVSSDAADDLDGTTTRLAATLLVAVVATVVAVATMWVRFRRSVETPLDELGRDANLVAGGELGHPVTPVGPEELWRLGEAMEQMRLRIIEELVTVREARDEIEAQARELSRSNAELEQFAYVASHDLQEPLRKVASFCQLLQSRYGGTLDERADQYIAFAVDGAKRMQELINDLLAFSRVGRVEDEHEPLGAGALLDRALSNLSEAIEESGASIDAGPLPEVHGDRNLLVAVFQNLVGNALKFRRPEVAPSVRISANSRDGFHTFTVADNGIGIEPEYAERVFVLFQRLHTRDLYGGTGIGLALCRKIIEHHGGRIWVDTDVAEGTAIRFTLPSTDGVAP